MAFILSTLIMFLPCRYQNAIETVVTILFLVLYSIVINLERADVPSTLEWVLYTCVLAYVIDDIRDVGVTIVQSHSKNTDRSLTNMILDLQFRNISLLQFLGMDKYFDTFGVHWFVLFAYGGNDGNRR